MLVVVPVIDGRDGWLGTLCHPGVEVTSAVLMLLEVREAMRQRRPWGSQGNEEEQDGGDWFRQAEIAHDP